MFASLVDTVAGTAVLLMPLSHERDNKQLGQRIEQSATRHSKELHPYLLVMCDA